MYVGATRLSHQHYDRKEASAEAKHIPTCSRFLVSRVEGDRLFGHKLNGVSPCDWARYWLVLATGNLSLFWVQKMGLRIGRADSDLVDLCVTGALGKWEHGE